MSRPHIVCALLALVTLLVYLPVRHYAFIKSDSIQKNFLSETTA